MTAPPPFSGAPEIDPFVVRDGVLDLEAGLNDEQRAAILAPDGPVLIIAAAGTGKTRTLVYRVAHLVERGIDPRRILLLTFTNRAAKEMLERARALAGESVGGMWGGTFHHATNRILRTHAEAAGYRPDYTILDRDDARSLLRAAVTDLGLKDKHFPKPDVLMSLYGLAVSTERSLEDLARERFEKHPVRVEDVLDVHQAYERRKRELNVMDFDDLLVNGLRLFRDRPDILEHYRNRFLYILVDEYQDTNKIQAAWVDLLAAQHRNLLVVGDDFQSIYAWRGANFRNILDFPKRYPDASVFKLETNYRSVPEILAVANKCIAGNPDQFQKKLRAVRPAAQRPRLVELPDGHAQAFFVIEELGRLRREGWAMKDVAILYRSHFHAMEIQLELARHRVPYVITSGIRFFEQAHVKDACCVLRLLANPGDELAFVRLLELLPRVGHRTALKIWARLGHRLDVASKEAHQEVVSLLPAPAREGWAKIAKAFEPSAAGGGPVSMADTLATFLNEFYDGYAVEVFDNYQRRLEDIEELVDYTSRFDSVEDFLSEVALATNLDADGETLAADHADAVRLTTVHQAKGLEWGVVFILWMSDGMFPSARAVGEGGEGEERRLFYVATTRAKDALYLCMPSCRRSRDGNTTFYMRSRFITELPPNLLAE